jgi:hypothetical protein
VAHRIQVRDGTCSGAIVARASSLPYRRLPADSVLIEASVQRYSMAVQARSLGYTRPQPARCTPANSTNVPAAGRLLE